MKSKLAFDTLSKAITITDTAESAAKLLRISKSTLFRQLGKHGMTYRMAKKPVVLKSIKQKENTDDLAADLIKFLESKGLQVYKMKVEAEAYQVQAKDQVIRFYVKRNTAKLL